METTIMGLYRDYCNYQDPFLHSWLTNGKKELESLGQGLGFRD